MSVARALVAGLGVSGMQDGNIHCHVDNLSRRSAKHGTRYAIATAAYTSGQCLWSDSEQRPVDFGNRQDVVFSRIVLPDDAPAWAADRQILWNKVDLAAQRKDARLAKVIEAAIMRDVPSGRRVDLILAFVAPYTALGCVADVAIHEDGTGHNPHVHVLLTTRRLTAEGFAAKLAALDQRNFVKQARKRWADLTNQFLQEAGSSVRVDHRSYRARGIGAEPTQHRGPNDVERREKREHARRVREEQAMRRPDSHEKRDYPLLTARETWPPEPAPSSDMNPAERDEHHRYWQDRKLEAIEAREQQEPDDGARVPEPARAADPVEREPPASLSDLPWYRQALEVARGSSEPENPGARESRRPEEDEPDRGGPTYDYEATVRERALAMRRSREENEVMDAVRYEHADVRRFVHDFVLHQRMQRIRDEDIAERLGLMEPRIRDRLEALRPSAELERHFPEPGPNREFLSRYELEQARNEMLKDYEREQTDREERER